MIQEITELIKKGGIVCFCGSGLSAESGVATFRGAGGLWEKYDPAIYASVDAIMHLFLHQPHKLAEFTIDFYQVLLTAKPNYAHYALAELEKRDLLIGTITQNIDDFHGQAGAVNIAEVHGNSYVFECKPCGYRIKKEKQEVSQFIDTLKNKKTKERIAAAMTRFMGKCPYCHRRCESGIVLFGQSLPQEEIRKTYSYIGNAKAMLCVGTSGVVYPAASFPYHAKESGLKVINVNIETNPIDQISDFIVRETSVNFFKKLLPHL